MNAIRTAALAAALSLSPAVIAPAQAMTAANVSVLLARDADIAKAELVLGDRLVPSRSAAQNRANAATQSYFDFDALITLGALALAGGAMAAFGAIAARRKSADALGAANSDDAPWRDSVFRNLQADLAALADTYRRAA